MDEVRKSFLFVSISLTLMLIVSIVIVEYSYGWFSGMGGNDFVYADSVVKSETYDGSDFDIIPVSEQEIIITEVVELETQDQLSAYTIPVETESGVLVTKPVNETFEIPDSSNYDFQSIEIVTESIIE